MQAELFELDDDEMERAVRQEFAALLGIEATPLFTLIARYPNSMPQYLVGHLGRVDGNRTPAGDPTPVWPWPGMPTVGLASRIVCAVGKPPPKASWIGSVLRSQKLTAP